MAGLVDVPDVDHGRAGAAERAGEPSGALDHTVLGRERRRARGGEGAVLADCVVLEVDDEQRRAPRIELQAPTASAISEHVATAATFCMA